MSTKHWSETDEREDRDEAAPSRLELEAGDVRARANACARLRALLADGRWHDAPELVQVGGLRYGGRLHEIRRGQDGAPALDVEAEPHARGGRQVWALPAAAPAAPSEVAMTVRQGTRGMTQDVRGGRVAASPRRKIAGIFRDPGSGSALPTWSSGTSPAGGGPRRPRGRASRRRAGASRRRAATCG